MQFHSSHEHWPLSRWRMTGALVASLLIVPVTVMAWRDVMGDGGIVLTVLMPLSLVFPAWWAAIAVRGVVRGGGVTLRADGVHVRVPMGSAHVPWTSIEAVDLAPYGRLQFFGLVLRPGAPARVSPGLRFQSRFNKRLPGDVNVPSAVPGLEGLREAVEARLAQYRGHDAGSPHPR